VASCRLARAAYETHALTEILGQLKARASGRRRGIQSDTAPWWPNGYDGREGGFSSKRVRALVGPTCVIGKSSSNPHCHLNGKALRARRRHRAVQGVTAHTYFVVRAVEETAILRCAPSAAEIKPVKSVFDCRMLAKLSDLEPSRCAAS